MAPKKDIYDFVVIGSGVCGALAAYKLSARKGVSVLLIEAGDEPELQEQREYTGTEAERNAAVSNDNRAHRAHMMEAFVRSEHRSPLTPYEEFASDRHVPSPDGGKKEMLERYYEFKHFEDDKAFFKGAYRKPPAKYIL